MHAVYHPTGAPQNCTGSEGYVATVPAYAETAVPDNGVPDNLLTEHEDIFRIRGRPFLSLRCRSRAGRPQHKPLYFDGDVITGSVQLMLHNPMHVENIFVQVRGYIEQHIVPVPAPTSLVDFLHVPALPSGTFWSTDQVLWTAGSKLLRNSLLETPLLMTPGNYSFPFRIQLPLGIETLSSNGSRTYPLPPSYRRSGSSALLQYEIVITVDRGLFHESLLHTVVIVYLPRSSPKYPWGKERDVQSSDGINAIGADRSQARTSLLSYMDVVYIGFPFSSGLSLESSGPEYRSRELKIAGIVFRRRPVQVHCQVMRRLPLIYARGTEISLLIVMESADEQALDVLASPDSLCLRLHEKLTAGGNVSVHTLAEGRFCSRTAVPTLGNIILPGGKQRWLEGVLLCPADLKPTFRFPGIALEHFLSIRFVPKEFFALSSEHPVPQALQSVEIVTNTCLPARGSYHTSSLLMIPSLLD